MQVVVQCLGLSLGLPSMAVQMTVPLRIVGKRRGESWVNEAVGVQSVCRG